jgi:enoyl-CoA hydratase/carnithine racemase
MGRVEVEPAALGSGAPPAACRLSIIETFERANALVDGLAERRLDDLDTVVVTKSRAGFGQDCIARLQELVRDAAAGRLGRLKFLVFDFNHLGEADASGDPAFEALVSEAANLILRAPVVMVANARGCMAGDDLEFALACSMLIGEADARFSFAADPIVSIGTYGFLAQKIGFVRAERLMEGGEVLDAQQMHDQLLLKVIAEPGSGIEGVRRFLARNSRRHNSCYGIYRAHRMASPTGRDAFRAIG